VAELDVASSEDAIVDHLVGLDCVCGRGRHSAWIVRGS
jgi:hypothetical protein